MSLTSSMDEADMEVAGIYKKFKTESPLAVRMEEIAATPPPRAKPMPKTGVLAQSLYHGLSPNFLKSYLKECNSIDIWT